MYISDGALAIHTRDAIFAHMPHIPLMMHLPHTHSQKEKI
jgi:hypothetical protein